MTWQLYQVTYELTSPLHVGYHKIGNLQRTRYYIPARNLWGAVTETLTRRGFGKTHSVEDYPTVGDWVQEHCAFTYWFVREGDAMMSPCYADEGLKYGSLEVSEFERRYLDSHVTTALDAATTTAQDESLHEVEFIAPYTSEGARTIIGGWVLLDEDAQAQKHLGEESGWRAWLGALQVGGERRYGFGQLRLCKFTKVSEMDKDGWEWKLGTKQVTIEADKPLFAHALASEVEARGAIEPLVGRETSHSGRFGWKLSRAQVCWTPGARLTGARTVEIGARGVLGVSDL